MLHSILKSKCSAACSCTILVRGNRRLTGIRLPRRVSVGVSTVCRPTHHPLVRYRTSPIIAIPQSITMAARGKTRRASSPLDSPTDVNESADFTESDVAMMMLQGGVTGSQSGKECSSADMLGASELLELNRRCFSCCNVALQLQAALVGSTERSMVSKVPPSFSGIYTDKQYAVCTRRCTPV